MWSCYMRSPCGRGREAVLTGWSAEAAPVALPKGVSYSVGAGTGIRHVVLQVIIAVLGALQGNRMQAEAMRCDRCAMPMRGQAC